MGKLRFWFAPVALCGAWMAVAAFVLFRLSSLASQPVATFYAPEVVIEVREPTRAFANQRAEGREAAPASVRGEQCPKARVVVQ